MYRQVFVPESECNSSGDEIAVVSGRRKSRWQRLKDTPEPSEGGREERQSVTFSNPDSHRRGYWFQDSDCTHVWHRGCVFFRYSGI